MKKNDENWIGFYGDFFGGIGQSSIDLGQQETEYLDGYLEAYANTQEKL